MCNMQWFAQFWDIINFNFKHIMILFPQPYFVLMLYSMELMNNPVRTSKSP